MHQYVVIVEKSTLPEDIKSLKKCSDDHLDYLRNLQKSGNLEIAGKFIDETGGMYILLANSDEEAYGNLDRHVSVEYAQWFAYPTPC